MIENKTPPNVAFLLLCSATYGAFSGSNILIFSLLMASHQIIDRMQNRIACLPLTLGKLSIFYEMCDNLLIQYNIVVKYTFCESVYHHWNESA